MDSPGARVGEEGEDEWEDDGGWHDADDSIDEPAGKSWKNLPNDWIVNVKEDDGSFKVMYTSPDGTILRNKVEVKEYLASKAMDPDIVEVIDFSQRFARLVYKGLGKRSPPEPADPSSCCGGGSGGAARGGAASEAAQVRQSMPESAPLVAHAMTLTEGEATATEGPTAAEWGGGGAHVGAAYFDTDEAMARRMQAAFDEEETAFADNGSEGGSEYTLSSSDHGIGDVAAGGWRMREMEQREDKADDEDINSMKMQTLTADGDPSELCPVCQDVWKAGQQVRVLPCDHQYHVSCIDKWLKDHDARCPLCKKDVREDWEDEEEEVWDPVEGKWISSLGVASLASLGGAAGGEGAAAAAAAAGGEDGTGSEASWETCES